MGGLVIEVRLFASLRRYRPEGSDSAVVTADVPDGISLGELLEELEIAAGDVKTIMVNGLPGSPEQLLSDGDRVELFPADFSGKPLYDI